MRSIVKDALWLAYLAGWEADGKDFKKLTQEQKDALILKYMAWIKDMTE